MMRVLALSLAALMFAKPTAVLAEEPQADIAIIRRAGAPAPFEGVLYSNLAFVQMRAEREQAEARAKNKLDMELGIQRARLTTATATTATALAAQVAKFDQIMKIKDSRIAGLEADLVKASDRASGSSNVVWLLAGVGGTLVVVAVTALVVGIKGSPIVINGTSN